MSSLDEIRYRQETGELKRESSLTLIRHIKALLVYIDDFPGRECAPCNDWLIGHRAEIYAESSAPAFCPWCGGRVKP